MTSTTDSLDNEQTIWEGSPSQWMNIGPFIIGILFCWLVLPLLWAVGRYLQVRCTRYRLSTQRLSIRTGVFNVRAADIEHYRIKDYLLDLPLVLRLVDLGNIQIVTSDPTYQNITLHAISNPEAVREQLRNVVEQRRDAKGVREVDFR